MASKLFGNLALSSWPSSVATERYYSPYPTFVSEYLYSTPSAGTGGTYYGASTPSFFKKLRSKQLLPSNPYTRFDTVIEASSLSYVLANRKSKWRMVNQPVTPIGPIGSNELGGSTGLDGLLTQALARLYTSGWDALTFFAEFDKTIAMFRKAWSTLLSKLDELIRKAARSGLRDWDSLWLELRYGWRPLYFDMQDIAKMISSLDDKRTIFSARSHGQHSESIDSHAGFGVLQFGYKQTTDLHDQVRVFSQIRPPRVLFDPVMTTWELIRFSFIIDWFIGVGDWLASLNGALWANDITAAYSRSITMSRKSDGTCVSTNPIYTLESSSVAFESHATLLDRTPISASPPVLPSWRANLDWFKIQDLSSIMRQLARSYQPS